jgi:TRAP-type C4-dicarboxylate transport system permease small subunit
VSLDLPVPGRTGGVAPTSPARQWAARCATLLERALDTLAAAAVAAMAAAMFYQVFGRYVLSHAPSWSEELARYLMVWLTMLGSAAVLRTGGHITVTTLTDALPPGMQKAVLAVRDTILVCTCGALAWWGIGYARINGAQESAGMEIPMSIPYAALPVGAALIAVLVLLARFAGAPAVIHGEEEAF